MKNGRRTQTELDMTIAFAKSDALVAKRAATNILKRDTARMAAHADAQSVARERAVGRYQRSTRGVRLRQAGADVALWA